VARRCVFCGGSPLSREHVVPRWLTNALPEQARFRGQDQQIVLQFPGHAQSRLVLPHREMREPFNGMTVKAVCRSCNSGWMGGIEETVRPILSPLFRGKSQELKAVDAQVIATWAVKTALMAQLTSAEGMAALGPIYRAFYAERTPPQNSVVWAAGTGGGDWGLRSEIVGALIATEEESEEATPDDPVNTISATLGLGHLLLHTVLTARASVSYPPLDEIHEGAVTRLWPGPTDMVLLPQHWLLNEVAWIISRSFAYWVSGD
jgi:hypothetical protein